MNRLTKWSPLQAKRWTSPKPAAQAQDEMARARHFDQPSHPAASSRLEMLLLFLSYVHRLATVIGALLLCEILVSGVAPTRGADFLSRALLPLGLLGIVNIPFLFWIRIAGVRRFHFLEHEARLDAVYLPAQLASRERTPEIHDEMRALVQAIDAADVWDRPAARCAVKTWIVRNRSDLDKAAWDYLCERVGYLLPGE